MPTKADANRAQLIRRTQTAWGEAPPLNGATIRERLLSESLHHKNTTAISEELRYDLQRTDQILMGYDVDGDIVEEMSYGNQEWMWEAALGSVWVAKSPTLSVGTTNASPTVTAVNISADDLHKAVTGTGIPASSYIGVVTPGVSFGLSSSATANTPVNATATATVTATIANRGDSMINGTATPYFTFERGYTDIARYIQFRDCAINTLALDITARRILRVTAGIMGGAAIVNASTGILSMAGSTTPTEPTTRNPIGAGPLIQLANSGGSNIELNAIETKEIKFMINRNLRIRDVATAYQSADFGKGSMELTGSLNAYFNGVTEYNGFIANSKFSLRWTVQDPLDTTKTYRWTLPTLKVQDLNPAIGGIDQDVMMNIPFRAFLDPAVGYAIYMERGVSVG